VIWIDGATKLEVFAESGGVSSSGPARISGPHWIVRANSVEHAGWGEASLDDTERDVKASAVAWWNAHARTL
jgi:hypothetical protein